MTPEDISAAVELVGRAMNSDEAAQAKVTFENHFNCQRATVEDGRQYHALVSNDVLAGMIGLHHYVWGPPENVWLAWFAVDPSLKGQGIGPTLFQFAQERARQQGYRKLFVETYSTPEFAAARTFYQKMGMVPAGIVTPYLPDGGNMIVYYKDLSNDA